MKYIKTFESSNEFYKKLGNNLQIRKRDLRVFGEKESEEIKKIANYYKLKILVEKKHHQGFSYDSIWIWDAGFAFEKAVDVFLYIYKTDDEWYYIAVRSSDIGQLDTYSWFKCDQIEGVIKCLQDEILKKV